MKKIFLLLAMFLSSCSVFSDDISTGEEKMAILRVCDEYMRNIVSGRSAMAEGMIGWPEYAPSVDDGVTRADLVEMIETHRSTWSMADHPLLGLDVISVRSHSDDAKVVLEKKTTKKKVELELKWVGRGWVIINDNIFSKDGIYR